MNRKLLGREPAMWLSLIAILVKLVSAFGFDVSVDVQAWINGAAAAGVGLLLAIAAKDGVGAAVLGLAQASLALAVGLGLDWTAEKQAVVMTFVAIVIGMFDRTQVTAPVPAAAVRKPTPVS